ncbi:MAG: GPW/gp25 family protein [Deltaproteobacteria bacterium]|nr:GPW/gp25 family protein [Deltaproteobacteria bacterium]
MPQEFLGKGLKFPIKIGSDDGLAKAEGEEKIRDSVINILSTSIGERVMRPNFGSKIHNHIFDTINSATKSSIAFNIQEALIEWEPRIEVENVQTSDDRAHEGVLLISIDYKVRSTNNRFNLVYPFFLKGFLS